MNSEIKFKTYDDMIEIEKILTSSGYFTNHLDTDTTYYTEYSETAIMGYMQGSDFLVASIDVKYKTYIIIYPDDVYDPKCDYEYPRDKIIIRTHFLKPSYKGRTIKK